MADLKFGDRTYRKMGDTWMMQPATLMRGFIAVAEESTSVILDEIERLRAAGHALAAALRRHQMACGVNDASTAVAAWQEACRER